jgi:long-chain-fatty-acid--CoA ligase ACSBG
MNNLINLNELNKNGPDQIISSDSFYSSKLNKPVKLRSNEIDLKLFPVQSIYTLFKQTVLKQPSHPALAYKSDDKKWHFISYNEYWQLCIKAAKSFIKLKLEPNTGVVTILGFNSHQWFISCLGSIFASGISCGIYTTNSTETCEFIFSDTKSEIIVVENKQQLDKILKCKNINNIRKIIQYTGTVENSMNGLVISVC